MIFEMLRWWYGTGWLQAAHRVITWTKEVERAYSASILFRTLFAPWHRIISVSGKSLDDKMRAGMDNFISRLVGGVVRSGTLLAAGFSMLGVSLLAIVMVGVWPLLPISVVYFIVRSITG